MENHVFLRVLVPHFDQNTPAERNLGHTWGDFVAQNLVHLPSDVVTFGMGELDLNFKRSGKIMKGAALVFRYFAERHF